MFIIIVINTQLVQAKYQRLNLYKKDNIVTLETLINNLTNKAYIKSKSSLFRLAFYNQKGRKDNNNKYKGGDKGKGKKGKQGASKEKAYLYCYVPNAKHNPKDYLAINTKKYKEQKEKNKKKQLPFNKFKK